MVTPVQPITLPPTVPVVTEPERILTEGEGGAGQPPAQYPAPSRSVARSQHTETEQEAPAIDFSTLVAMLRSMMASEDVELEFAIDEATQKLVLRIRDAQTKEILQQIPPDIALRIARFVMELLQREGIVTNVRV